MKKLHRMLSLVLVLVMMVSLLASCKPGNKPDPENPEPETNDPIPVYKPELLDIVEQYCSDMQFMPIIKSEEELEQLKDRHIRLVGHEVLFRNDTSPLASREFIDKCHRRGELVWCNAIVYNYKSVLAGGHSDDRAAEGDLEGSWGWIADRGFDLIQTDWMLSCRLFLEQTGRLYKG